MYDRTLKPIPVPETTGLRNRIETLVGITGWKMAKYRAPWQQIVTDPIRIVWRPHVLPVLFFEAALFGFGIGINVSSVSPYHTPLKQSFLSSGDQCRLSWRTNPPGLWI
jgi:hypothetical protein